MLTAGRTCCKATMSFLPYSCTNTSASAPHTPSCGEMGTKSHWVAGWRAQAAGVVQCQCKNIAWGIWTYTSSVCTESRLHWSVRLSESRCGAPFLLFICVQRVAPALVCAPLWEQVWRAFTTLYLCTESRACTGLCASLRAGVARLFFSLFVYRVAPALVCAPLWEQVWRAFSSLYLCTESRACTGLCASLRAGVARLFFSLFVYRVAPALVCAPLWEQVWRAFTTLYLCTESRLHWSVRLSESRCGAPLQLFICVQSHACTGLCASLRAGVVRLFANIHHYV